MIATSLEDDQRLLEISHFHSMPISCLGPMSNPEVEFFP